MAKLFDSLRNTRWVIWSSPLLLLILVFTLRTHPVTPATTLFTSTVSHPTTTLAAPSTTRTTSATTRVTRPRSTQTNVPPTSVPRASVAGPSSPSTVSNGARFATARAASASTDALSGTLGPGAAPVVLPLNGPATWTLVANATLRATLNCGSQSIPVASLIVVAAQTSCQLSLQATQATTWQLTPLR